MIFLAALLLAGRAAAAANPPAELTSGDWNARIHATHALAELGADGLPGLRIAAGDADWQVRMTAVHLMGRVGEAAVPDLAQVLRTEPCRHVRLTALHWLGTIGGDRASEALKEGLSDESGMVRLMGRYWLDKAGGREEGFNPDETAAVAEDLKYCETSPQPRRASWAVERKAPAAPPADGEIDEVVVTPDPTVRRSTASAETPVKSATETLPDPPSTTKRNASGKTLVRAEPVDRARLKELDALLAPDAGEAETLPGGAAVPGRVEAENGAATTFVADPRRAPSAAVRAPRPKAAPESMPAGTPGLPERPASETAGAAIMADAGTGKTEIDPLPSLLKLLADADPKIRARAADDLGKRGPAAASAESALAAALKDSDRRVRASAALALGNLGAAADSAVPALVAALKRGPEETSWSAAVALGRIGTPRARRAFARYARQSAGDLVRGEKKP
jgi:hypothetical protein